MSEDKGIEYRFTPKAVKTYEVMKDKDYVGMVMERSGRNQVNQWSLLAWAGCVSCGGKMPVSKDQVFIEYGRDGLDTLNYLEDQGFLKRIEKK